MEPRNLKNLSIMMKNRGFSEKYMDIDGDMRKHVYESQDGKCKRVLVYLDISSSGKLGLKGMNPFIDMMEKDGFNHGILIHKSGMHTNGSRSKADDSGMKIEIFRYDYFNLNIIDFKYVPKHRILDRKSKEYQYYSKENIPKILIDDPISKYYCAEVNDIFEIERHDGSIYYRMVIELE